MGRRVSPLPTFWTGLKTCAFHKDRLTEIDWLEMRKKYNPWGANIAATPKPVSQPGPGWRIEPRPNARGFSLCARGRSARAGLLAGLHRHRHIGALVGSRLQGKRSRPAVVPMAPTPPCRRGGT